MITLDRIMQAPGGSKFSLTNHYLLHFSILYPEFMRHIVNDFLKIGLLPNGIAGRIIFPSPSKVKRYLSPEVTRSGIGCPFVRRLKNHIW